MDFLLHFGPSHYMDLFRCEHPYFCREGKGNAFSFIDTYFKNYALTNKKGLICIPSGNHDMERIRKYLDEEELKMVFAFLLSMPGAPFLYYGDEIGMKHLEIPSVEGGYNRTGARTPMQWNGEKNYGFSEAPVNKLYTQQDSSENAPVVSERMADAGSLWNEIRKLCKIRKEFPALCASGSIQLVYCEPEKYPLVYLRTSENEKILVVLNPSGKDTICPCSYKLKDLIYTLGKSISIEDGILHIPAQSAGFIKVDTTDV